MPEIKLTDQFGLTINVAPDPVSAFAKYFRDIPALLMQGADISRLRGLDLSDPAIGSLHAGLVLDQPVSIDAGGAAFAVRAGLSGGFDIFVATAEDASLFGPDDYGEDIQVPADERYVSLSITASAGVDVMVAAGQASFGFEPGSSFTIANYRRFATQPQAPSAVSALTATIQSFCLPRDLDDLRALAEGSFVTLTGRGTLTLSADANLVALANPLASVALPVLPALNVQSGESIRVGASFEISGDYQVRMQKLSPSRIRLGYRRRRGTDLEITASASAGLSASLGNQDLFPRLIRALSKDAAAAQQELEAAGLSPEQAGAIEAAVKGGVQRNLEVGAAVELGAMGSTETAFLYEVDLDKLDATGREAVQAALRGDLSRLAGVTGAVPGITPVRNVLAALRERNYTLKVNLLGIYNFVSTTQLALSGKVVFEPVTGDIVISDTATAGRFESAMVNFGADTQKLRSVLAESFLITAAYRGSNSLPAAPQLKSSHTFFELNNKTNQQTMRDDLDVGVALGLLAPAERDAFLDGLDEFGRTQIYAATDYDDTTTSALFLDGGQPRRVEEYETAGREAIRLLVQSGDPDAYRLRPATDDALWARMKAAGQFNFKPLLPDLTAQQVLVIGADYTVTVWWAATMRSTAEKLAAIRTFLQGRPRPDWNDAAFQALREDLARHLKAVARDTKEEFGRPWGLIAMDRLSRGAAGATVQVTGPRVGFRRQRPQALAAETGSTG